MSLCAHSKLSNLFADCETTTDTEEHTDCLGQERLDAHHMRNFNAVEVAFDLGNARTGRERLHTQRKEKKRRRRKEEEEEGTIKSGFALAVSTHLYQRAKNATD